jgi:hypothetical protein
MNYEILNIKKVEFLGTEQQKVFFVSSMEHAKSEIFTLLVHKSEDIGQKVTQYLSEFINFKEKEQKSELFDFNLDQEKKRIFPILSKLSIEQLKEIRSDNLKHMLSDDFSAVALYQVSNNIIKEIINNNLI